MSGLMEDARFDKKYKISCGDGLLSHEVESSVEHSALPVSALLAS